MIKFYQFNGYIRVSDKYRDFVEQDTYNTKVLKVERIKEELVNFRIKPKDYWYIRFYFEDSGRVFDYQMDHSTDKTSKFKQFRIVVDKAFMRFNVNLNELIDKRFEITVEKINRLHLDGNKYEIFYRISKMKLLEDDPIVEESNQDDAEKTQE